MPAGHARSPICGEKQNAEQGLMPVLEDAAGVYGMTAENRPMVESFRRGGRRRLRRDTRGIGDKGNDGRSAPC